jgi:hypothetical protein
MGGSGQAWEHHQIILRKKFISLCGPFLTVTDLQIVIVRTVYYPVVKPTINFQLVMCCIVNALHVSSIVQDIHFLYQTVLSFF